MLRTLIRNQCNSCQRRFESITYLSETPATQEGHIYIKQAPERQNKVRRFSTWRKYVRCIFPFFVLIKCSTLSVRDHLHARSRPADFQWESLLFSLFHTYRRSQRSRNHQRLSPHNHVWYFHTPKQLATDDGVDTILAWFFLFFFKFYYRP